MQKYPFCVFSLLWLISFLKKKKHLLMDYSLKNLYIFANNVKMQDIKVTFILLYVKLLWGRSLRNWIERNIQFETTWNGDSIETGISWINLIVLTLECIFLIFVNMETIFLSYFYVNFILKKPWYYLAAQERWKAFARGNNFCLSH